eukprot:SAG11_NODE_5133_length_1655_cov_14.872108_2_plen_119_part_00
MENPYKLNYSRGYDRASTGGKILQSSSNWMDGGHNATDSLDKNDGAFFFRHNAVVLRYHLLETAEKRLRSIKNGYIPQFCKKNRTGCVLVSYIGVSRAFLYKQMLGHFFQTQCGSKMV